MKAVQLARALAALCMLAQGVQLPEEGRRLMSALGGRGAAPSKATSLLQSLDEFVDADDTTDDETTETADAGSAAAQDASTEGAQDQEEADVVVDAALHRAEEVMAQAKSEGADQASAAGKSEVEGSTKKNKKKRKAGLFSLVKAQVDISEMNKKMDKLKWNLETSNNKTGRCHHKKEFYARKVYEIRAGRDFRRKAKGKHIVMNETLAKARRARGNFSTVGLWIITDEPPTKQDHEREKFQRSITRMTSQTDNVTKLEEAVVKYTELEQLYSTRAAFYADQIAELNATLQAALNLRDEAKHNLRPKRRQAKDQPIV